MSIRLVMLAALAAFALAPSVAHAQDCTLKQAASLDLIDSTDGRPLVSLAISGTTRYFYLDLATNHTVVSTAFADEQKLARKPLRNSGLVFVNGLAVLPTLQIGLVNGNDVPVWVSDVALSSDSDARAIGILGMDLLSNFDVELALASNKLNLFSHDHCPGKVVYWANEFTSVPLSYKASEDLHVEMDLDGKPIIVLLSPVAARSVITMTRAYEMFGLDETSPAMTPVAGHDKLYRYPFKTLSAAGVTINNPQIFVLGNRHDPVCDSRKRFLSGGNMIQCFGIDMMLTGGELRQLRIYLALEEKTAYITAASAHK